MVTLASGLVSPGQGTQQLIGRVGDCGSKLHCLTATIMVVVLSSKDFLLIVQPLACIAWLARLAERVWIEVRLVWS